MIWKIFFHACLNNANLSHLVCIRSDIGCDTEQHFDMFSHLLRDLVQKCWAHAAQLQRMQQREENKFCDFSSNIITDYSTKFLLYLENIMSKYVFHFMTKINSGHVAQDICLPYELDKYSNLSTCAAARRMPMRKGGKKAYMERKYCSFYVS